jgi:hypothetical protein
VLPSIRSTRYVTPFNVIGGNTFATAELRAKKGESGAAYLRLRASRLRDTTTINVVPPLCPLAASSYDFSSVGEMIDPAAKSTRKKLARNGLKRQGGAND